MTEQLRVAGCQLRAREDSRPAASSIPHSQLATHNSQLHLALDFGFADPFVCLWIVQHGAIVHVIDEYVQPQRTIAEHLQQMQLRRYGDVAWIACDPAGNGRSDQTAVSNVALLRHAGYRLRYRTSRIVDGLELIRTALRPAAGEPALFIHPRCARLIRALQSYRYPDTGGELPLKDGEHDHLIDALRYFFVNRRSGNVKVSNY